MRKKLREWILRGLAVAFFGHVVFPIAGALLATTLTGLFSGQAAPWNYTLAASHPSTPAPANTNATASTAAATANSTAPCTGSPSPKAASTWTTDATVIDPLPDVTIDATSASGAAFSYTVVAKDLSDREETAARRDDEFGLALPEGLALALPLSIALWAVMA